MSAVRRALGVLGLATFLAILVIVFSTTADHFFAYSNLIIVLSSVAVIGISSIGQTFAIISGGFDLSVSGILPMGAVVFGILANDGFPLLAALVLAILVGACVGLVNGMIITLAGIDPLITTLGMLSVTGGLALVITNGVNKPFDNIDDGVLAVSSVGDIPNPIWILLGLALVAAFVLSFTVYGRMLFALGGNREASRLAGLRTALLTTSVYVVSGALAAFAGVVVASQLLSGSPTVGRDASLTSIAAVILGGGVLGGGRGGVFGTLLGVLVLGTLSNGLALLQIPSFYQQIATGGVLLIAVGFSRLQKAAVKAG